MHSASDSDVHSKRDADVRCSGSASDLHSEQTCFVVGRGQGTHDKVTAVVDGLEGNVSATGIERKQGHPTTSGGGHGIFNGGRGGAGEVRGGSNGGRGVSGEGRGGSHDACRGQLIVRTDDRSFGRTKKNETLLLVNSNGMCVLVIFCIL